MPDDDEAAAASWVEKALHDINRLVLLDRNHPVPEHEQWKQGAAPTSGPSFLVADGYLSRSAPGGKPRYRPLIELIGAELRAAQPAWPVYGLSYRNPLRHYVRQDTQFNPMIESGQKFRPYLPNEGCHVTYIGYSLGALTILLGLDHALSVEGFSIKQLAERCPRIVLCQPAIALGPDVQRQLARTGRAAPVTLLAMARGRARILANVERVIDRLTAHGIRVAVVAWQADRFIDLSLDLTNRLQNRGANVWPVTISHFTPLAKNPFIEHCYVPTQEPFLDRIREILLVPDRRQVELP